MKQIVCIIVSGLLAGPAWAAPTVDGTRDAQYGAPLAVQTVETQFGDNLSELDAAYALCESGKLYLLLTGNIEANFNNLEIFIDSKAGGQSTFDSAHVGGPDVMDGFAFDSGFTADYHLFARRGNFGGDKFDLDFADLGAAAFTSYTDILGGLTGTGTTGTGTNAVPIAVGYNDSNAAGVAGGMAAANQAAAAAVTTGLELAIALSDLDYTGGGIRIMAGVNGGNHDYWSNQFLAGLPAPQGNLGGDGAGTYTGEGAIDIGLFGGAQFFTACAADAESLAAAPATSRTGLLVSLAMLLGIGVLSLRRSLPGLKPPIGATRARSRS